MGDLKQPKVRLAFDSRQIHINKDLRYFLKFLQRIFKVVWVHILWPLLDIDKISQEWSRIYIMQLHIYVALMIVIVMKIGRAIWNISFVTFS